MTCNYCCSLSVQGGPRWLSHLCRPQSARESDEC